MIYFSSMKILGIETSCDETAVAVLDAGENGFNVLSNVVSSQVKLHAEHGGVVPNLAAREHVKNISHVFETALKKADVGIADIDLIAVTHGPGLGPALLVGLAFARTLAMMHDKPLIGVDHMKGHIYSNWLPNTESHELTSSRAHELFPALNLIVSGGHTELVLMSDYENFTLIGETMDDAVGEAFDKVARLLGLGYPGGPAISAKAEQFTAPTFTKNKVGAPTVPSVGVGVEFPRPMLHSKNFNFSFSGLKTAVLYKIRDLKNTGVEIDDNVVNEIAHAFQEAVVDVLIQKTISAAEKHGVKSIFLSGGVSANKLLRSELQKASEKYGFVFSCPPLEYTTDNAAMIAVAGYFAFRNRPVSTSWKDAEMNANLGF
ncbi:MAG: putative tRNA threonylcarbamoyladenosine biosynthesis protein Gcp [Parcubacteria group bacterium GW2011_GWA1_49_11]|nr:MAG: putative tRNA threonylcarbamoyladenosine biosynthesis protein Gcp [Parcubacteria group bacterium GW2011_GWA1_49_11]